MPDDHEESVQDVQNEKINLNTTTRLLTITSKYQSLPLRGNHETFIRDSIEILLNDAIFNGTNRHQPVLQWCDPDELMKLFDFQLDQFPLNHDDLLDIIKKIIKYSVKTGHPYFVNQLFSSVDPYGLVGQWLTDALNPSIYTYEVSPVFTLMEDVVLEEMRKFVGFTDGDGIFCPGGSLANGCAINCARYKLHPYIKTKGLHSLPRLVLFTSEDAHYSIRKMASLMGIGSDNVYLIKTLLNGKMNVDDLIKQIEKSKLEDACPFMVCATAGTTVYGAYDPLDEIADICDNYGLWLHVDAAWGGGALLSDKYKQLLKGIQRADSVTWNPHKLLCAPQQCSTLLLKEKNILSDAHSTNAAYLFQKDKFYDIKYDTGDKHIQCGRRADVLKFWFMWKAKGTTGLQQHIEKNFDNSKIFVQLINNRPGFKLLIKQPECTNVCFWFIPNSLRNNEYKSDFKQNLHKIAPKIKEGMMKKGSMMVSYQSQHGHPNFFRIVFQNSGLDKRDMKYFIDEIETLGKDL